MKYMRNNKFKFRKIPFLLMLLLIFSAVVMAQGKRTITGVVTDTNGEPIVGANVVVQNNHSIGAITDIDGNFRLSLPQETKALVVSFIGMREKVIRITDKVDKIKVILEDDSQALEEVVVIGYGTVNKRDLTGSVLSACLIYECNSIRNCDRCCIPFRSFVRHRTADPVCADTRIGRRQRCLR